MKKLPKPKNKLILTFLTLLCLALCLCLCSCGGSMTDETVRAELERLLPLSYELNDIFWGEGLPVTDTETVNRYVPVDESCGYKTTEEILNKAAEVFSKSYLAEIKDAIFTDSDDIDPRYMDINGILKADKTNKGFNIQGNVDISTARIKKQNAAMVVVTASYEDGDTTEITLIMQEGKWYLDSPTY